MSEFERRLDAAVKGFSEHPDFFRQHDPYLEKTCQWIMESAPAKRSRPTSPTALNRNAALQLERLRAARRNG